MTECTMDFLKSIFSAEKLVILDLEDLKALTNSDVRIIKVP